MGAPQLLRVFLSLDCHFYIAFCTAYFPFLLLHGWDSMAQSSPVLLCLHWRSSISFCTSCPPLLALLWLCVPSSFPISTPQTQFGGLHFHSVLLRHLLCTPLLHTALPIWHSSLLVVSTLRHPNILYCHLNLPLDSQLAVITVHHC